MFDHSSTSSVTKSQLMFTIVEILVTVKLEYTRVGMWVSGQFGQ